ncbi:MAG: hypothetical protein KF850_20865, partial [Labilithrix sp.]|nr:hypothetical protein [Labilithrix sp.]
MRRALLPMILAVLTTACGPAPGRPASPTPNADGSAEAFDAREAEILRDLGAVDRRLAQRTRIAPSEADLRRVTMAAVLREDSTLAVVDG